MDLKSELRKNNIHAYRIKENDIKSARDSFENGL